MAKKRFTPGPDDFTALTLNRDDMAAMMGLTRWNLTYRYKHGFNRDELQRLHRGLTSFQATIEKFKQDFTECP